MAANNTSKSCCPIPQEASIKLPAVESEGEEIVGTVEPQKTSKSSFDLTELGLSAKPDHSGLTTMGRFLADEGISRMEKFICPLVQLQPQSTQSTEGITGESNINNRKTTSIVVEVGSVCSLDTYRIARDFGKK